MNGFPPIFSHLSNNKNLNNNSSRLNNNFEQVPSHNISMYNGLPSSREAQSSSQNYNNVLNSGRIQIEQMMDTSHSHQNGSSSIGNVHLLSQENQQLKKQLEEMRMQLINRDEEKERYKRELEQNRSFMANLLSFKFGGKKKEEEKTFVAETAPTSLISSNYLPIRANWTESIKFKWRDQKYKDEKEERRRAVELLQKEIESRQKARQIRENEFEQNQRLRFGIEGLRLERRLPPREEFPDLPQQAKVFINHVCWNRKESPTEVLVSGFGADITRKDLLTLSGTEWLNDEVINFFLNLIVERNSSDSNLPKVYTFNTFFYQKLCQVGFSGVKRWTRKVNIFEHQMLLVPIHLGNHWCMAIVDFDHQKIDYYDSLFGDNPQCLDLLRNYLAEESMDKRKQLFDTIDWSFVCRKDIPPQMNMCDCGMFACLFAEYASRRVPITFKQKHIKYFRERMAWEISQKKLLC